MNYVEIPTSSLWIVQRQIMILYEYALKIKTAYYSKLEILEDLCHQRKMIYHSF